MNRATAISAAAAIAILAGGAGYLWYEGNPASTLDDAVLTAQEEVLPVRTQPIALQSHTPELQLLGRVVSSSQARMSSILDAGVVRVNVVEGQRVNEGDALVELDPRNIETQVSQLRADAQRIKALVHDEHLRLKTDSEELAHVEKLLQVAIESRKRIELLRSKKITQFAEYQTALLAEERARLAVTRRKSSIREHNTRMAQLQADSRRIAVSLENAIADLEDTVINSPFSGRITAVHVAEGGRVRTGSPVLDMYDDSAVEIQSLIPTRYLPAVRSRNSGGPEPDAVATIDGVRLELKIDRFAAVVTPGRGGIDAYFRIMGGDFYPVLGRTVDINLTLAPLDDTIAVPRNAIYSHDRIYKIADGRLKSALISRHGQFDMDGATYVIATSDQIRSDELIVTSRLADPVDGIKVQVLPD